MNNKYQHRILTIPNLLSFFRFCLIPIIMYFYISKQDYLGTALLLFLSGITDIVDGFVARTFHMISDLGKILDPIADKLTQCTMLFCLLTRFPFMFLLLAMLIVKELYMSISGIYVIKKTKLVLGALWHGKIATILLDITMILHVIWFDIPNNFSNLCILLCFMMMVISLILYAKRNQDTLKQHTKML